MRNTTAVARLLSATTGVSRLLENSRHVSLMHTVVRAVCSSPYWPTDNASTPCQGLLCCSEHSSKATRQQQLPSCTTQETMQLNSFSPELSGLARGFPMLLNSVKQGTASNTSTGSVCRGFSSTASVCSDGDSAAADPQRRRRRSATESRAVMRRTTESRPAIEDVAVMSRSQLMRRNKPWLAEQCWQHGLSHDGLKDELIQRLLAWQGTDAGEAAAAAAQEAAAAARVALAAVAQGAAQGASASSSAGAAQPSATPASTSAAVPPAIAAAGTAHSADKQMAAHVVRPAAGACAAAAVAVTETESCDDADDVDATAAAAAAAAAEADSEGGAPSTTENGSVSSWQPPPSASAAAAASVGLFLQQLKQQPDNVALVGAARNAVEHYASYLLSQAQLTYGSGVENPSNLLHKSNSLQQTVACLSDTISCQSNPRSLATLAKACYSREVLSPLLAASLAEAVAAVAAQLGPQEVYGVLRLLVVHLDSAQEDPMGRKHMDRGFRVLAEGMIRCSEALSPMQLAEAVDLLGMHRYDDAFGLWMLAKEAAARLTEFDPVKEGSSVVQLLNAIADMHVADDAMTSDVAQAVQARKDSYALDQLAAIIAALQRMGYSAEL